MSHRFFWASCICVSSLMAPTKASCSCRAELSSESGTAVLVVVVAVPPPPPVVRQARRSTNSSGS